jgi:two-component system LytT family response regulator
MSYSIVIVDDEINAIEALEEVIKLCGNQYNIVAKCSNPLEAANIITEHNPDIVFMDIEMPGLNGFGVLEQVVDINFQTIFVTAYEQYAIKAIKKNALDYILKPINISEIRDALINAEKRVDNNNEANRVHKELIEKIRKEDSKKIKISTNKGIDFLDPDEIVRIEADGAYSTIYTTDMSEILITKTIKELLKVVDSDSFFRAHRSHIVNTNFINKYNKETNMLIMTDNSQVPISRRRYSDFRNTVGL